LKFTSYADAIERVVIRRARFHYGEVFGGAVPLGAPPPAWRSDPLVTLGPARLVEENPGHSAEVTTRLFSITVPTVRLRAHLRGGLMVGTVDREQTRLDLPLNGRFLQLVSLSPNVTSGFGAPGQGGGRQGGTRATVNFSRNGTARHGELLHAR